MVGIPAICDSIQKCRYSIWEKDLNRDDITYLLKFQSMPNKDHVDAFILMCFSFEYGGTEMWYQYSNGNNKNNNLYSPNKW